MAGKLRLGGVVNVQDINTGGKIRGEEMRRAVGKEVAKFPRCFYFAEAPNSGWFDLNRDQVVYVEEMDAAIGIDDMVRRAEAGIASDASRGPRVGKIEDDDFATVQLKHELRLLDGERRSAVLGVVRHERGLVRCDIEDLQADVPGRNVEGVPFERCLGRGRKDLLPE